MKAPKKRKVAALCGDGHIRLVEQDTPPLRDGAVLLEVHASLVSPGTELGGWRALAAKRESPDADAEPRPFGYSNAGVVLEVGRGVEEFSPGDRVACIGGLYAMHTDYAVVPHNLCAALPDAVTFVQGSYGMLSATALHALRRGTPEFGETTVIVGLGIVGQLAAQLYQRAGCYVVGWDTIGFRVETAGRWGIDAAVVVGDEDPVARTRAFTGNYGVDSGVLAFGGEADDALHSLEQCLKVSPDGHPMGTIVVVGGPRFAYSSTLTNVDIRRASRTGFGYHDEAWEHGPPYPPVFMRWTTRTNLELCMRMIAEGRLDVDVLTTHTIPLERADEGTSAALDEPDTALGLAFVRS